MIVKSLFSRVTLLGHNEQCCHYTNYADRLIQQYYLYDISHSIVFYEPASWARSVIA